MFLQWCEVAGYYYFMRALLPCKIKVTFDIIIKSIKEQLVFDIFYFLFVLQINLLVSISKKLFLKQNYDNVLNENLTDISSTSKWASHYPHWSCFTAVWRVKGTFLTGLFLILLLSLGAARACGITVIVIF